MPVFNVHWSKILKLINIDINTVSDENDNILCFIAECCHIIRASIKKYARNRTSYTQPKSCQKDYLENRNIKNMVV